VSVYVPRNFVHDETHFADDDRQPLNYRGITIISVPCKIYCNILNHRLSSWLENNNILCDEQNGFRRGRSCEEHIHSLYTILQGTEIKVIPR
jgi:hypothetical protein